MSEVSAVGVIIDVGQPLPLWRGLRSKTAIEKRANGRRRDKSDALHNAQMAARGPLFARREAHGVKLSDVSNIAAHFTIRHAR